MGKLVVVVGAGIIGVSSAILLQNAGHEVIIVAKQLGRETTSYGAGGFWTPYKAEPKEKVLKWSLITLEVYKEQQKTIPELIKSIDGYFVSQNPLLPEDIWFQDYLPNFHLKTDTSHNEVQYFAGATVPLVSTGAYLDHFYQYFKGKGGKIIVEEVFDLLETKKKYKAAAVVNCTGLGSKHLLKDNQMYELQGQIVRLEKSDKVKYFYDRVSELECADYNGAKIATYIFPRHDSIVVGGYAEPLSTLPATPDPHVTKLILERAKLLEPELENLKILEEWVGVRPCRKSIRLEAEWVGGKDLVIHNYGHGGSGWTVAWGCAQEVVTLLSHSVPKASL